MKKISFLLFVIAAMAVIFGCDDFLPGGSDNGDPEPEASELYVKAYIEPDFFGTDWTANVMLVEDALVSGDDSVTGDFAEGATVSVAGEAVTDVSAMVYYKDLTELASGDSIELDISYEDYSLTDSLTMPDAPEITSPAEQSPQTLSADITVEWNVVSPVPDAVAVFVGYTNTVSDSDYYAELDGDSVSHTIPGGTLKVSGFGSCTIQVWAINKKNLSGTGIDAESSYSVVNYNSVVITEPQ